MSSSTDTPGAHTSYFWLQQSPFPGISSFSKMYTRPTSAASRRKCSGGPLRPAVPNPRRWRRRPNASASGRFFRDCASLSWIDLTIFSVLAPSNVCSDGIKNGKTSSSSEAMLNPVRVSWQYPSGVISPAVVHPKTGAENLSLSSFSRVFKSKLEDVKKTTTAAARRSHRFFLRWEF